MIDTHAHIGIDDYENIDDIVASFSEVKVINVGTDQKRNEEVISLVSNIKNMYGTLGIHPEMASSYDINDLVYIEKNINKEKIVAVGEIGLDLYWRQDNIELQKELFIKQLDIARKYNKAVTIHSRNANDLVYEILSNYKDLKKVLHSFSGNLEDAKKFISINTMLGISGVITFKKANDLTEVVKEIPLEYLLLETDSPYLTPTPFRGQKNKPNNVLYIASKIAEIKGISVNEVIDATTKNAITQFDLER